MPRKPKVPSYCLHKASGRAVVRINGRDHYLGPYGTDESHAEYARLIDDWRVCRQNSMSLAESASAIPNSSLTISEVLIKYRDFAKSYYSKDGEAGKEYYEMGLALRPLRQLYGNTLAREFGPLKLVGSKY